MGKKKRRAHKHNQESEHLPGAATNHSNVARSIDADAPSFSNPGHHPHAPNVSPVGSEQRMPPPPPPAPTRDVTWAAASSHSSVAPSVNQPSGLPSVNQSGGSSTLVVPLTLSGIPITGGVIVAQAIYFPVSNVEFGGPGSTAPRQDAVNSGPSSNPAMAGSGIQGLHSAGGGQPAEMGGSNGADATSNGAAQPHNCQNRSG